MIHSGSGSHSGFSLRWHSKFAHICGGRNFTQFVRINEYWMIRYCVIRNWQVSGKVTARIEVKIHVKSKQKEKT